MTKSVLFLSLLLIAPTLVRAQMGLTWRQENSLDLRLADDCPPVNSVRESPAPLPIAQVREIAHLSEAAQGKALSEAMDNLNHCFKSDGQDQLAERVIIPGTRARLKADPPAPVKKDDGTMATADDWIRIDLLARVLVGEIASSPRCGDAHVKAVARVILNRMDYVKKDPTNSWKQFADRKDGDALINAITKKSMFSALDGKDPANKWFACPSTNIVQKYKVANAVFATGQNEYLNWFRAMEVATEMVLHEKTFRKETNSVKSLFYSKGQAVHDMRVRQGFTHVTNARIDGSSINQRNCIELWDDPKLKKHHISGP
ncbi:MAG: hypothetical protein KF802_10335 [Bdellovibrionaceae bacterium]|nr:hypothetical protein [Pseudobdellovibrionaceae bacterium]MBX3033808.1 hypothetical protein [Pseudobdellovibrionaceae bacterium]